MGLIKMINPIIIFIYSLIGCITALYISGIRINKKGIYQENDYKKDKEYIIIAIIFFTSSIIFILMIFK